MTCHYSGIRSVAMLLALIVCHVFVLSFANPFHKYPFVFLLDVGNEQLERVNTQQIRISTPGGSIAIRYPAVGEGDSIAHVRVSGIDFGTDLKANIVDGGPGYKYVVLVFMGNPGKPYDAVLTIQTVPDKAVQDNSASIEENDPNDSAEDLSDTEKDSTQEYLESSSAELMQSSSNVYNYAHDSESYIQNDGYVSQKDIHNPYSESFRPDETVEVRDYSEDYEDDENLNVIPKDEEYDDVNDDDGNNNEEGPSDDKVGPSEVFDEEDDPNFNNEYNDKSADYDDSEELDQTFNDEEVHGEKYKDSSNNNYEENDDRSAVAY